LQPSPGGGGSARIFARRGGVNRRLTRVGLTPPRSPRKGSASDPPPPGQGNRIWKTNKRSASLRPEGSSSLESIVRISILLRSRSDSIAPVGSNRGAQTQATDRTRKFHMRYPCPPGQGYRIWPSTLSR